MNHKNLIANINDTTAFDGGFIPKKETLSYAIRRVNSRESLLQITFD